MLHDYLTLHIMPVLGSGDRVYNCEGHIPKRQILSNVPYHPVECHDMTNGQSLLGEFAHGYQHKCQVHSKFHDVNRNFERAMEDIILIAWITIYSIFLASSV